MSKLLFISLLLVLLQLIAQSKADCSNDNVCYKTSHKLLDPATEEEATIEARCLGVCVDKLYTYCPTCQLVPSLQGQWNSISYVDIRSNCTSYQMLMDCQRGCIVAHSIGNISSQCTNQCMLQCPNISKYDSSPPSCTVQCTTEFCEFGCKVRGTDNILSSLPTPINEPILLSLKGTNLYRDGGQYVCNVASTNGITLAGSGGGGDIIIQSVMTTFVFKIEQENTSFYISMATSSGILELGFLTCTEVRISYKAVTQDGSSLYSPQKMIQTIDGSLTPVDYPGQVKKMEGHFVEDFREGFIGHTVATFFWSRPERAQYITRYRLIVLSPTMSCGGINDRYEYCIDKDATNFTIIAEAPDKPLFFRCRYSAKLISEPSITPILVSTFSINTESVSDPEPPLVVLCTRKFQADGRISLYAAWSVSYVPGLIEAMEKYTVQLELFDLSARSVVPGQAYASVDVYPNIDEKVNAYKVTDLPVITNEERKYRIRVYAHSNHMFPWRLMPGYGRCIIDSQPERPSPINISSIIIQHLLFSDTQLFLNVSWEFPSVTNGYITRFELRIAREPLLPSEHDDPTDYSYTHSVKGAETTAMIDTPDIYHIDKIACLYLQIRCLNNYLWANWSNHVMLSKYPNNPSCENIPVTTVTISVVPEPTTQRAIVSTVIGAVLGGLAGLVLLGILIAGAVVLCKRYRRRNRYLEAFKDSNADSLYIKGPLSAYSFSSKPIESPKLDEWEIPANLIVIEKRLGEGCFGEVYQGVVKGPINNSKIQASFKNVMCPIVAIKLLKDTASGSEKMDFLQEIDTMKTVSRSNNPHIVNMIGCVTIQEPLCLITEFVKHGDLLLYLQTIRKMVTQRQLMAAAAAAATIPSAMPSKRLSIAVPSPESEYAELGEIDSVNLLSFAYQIASGMEFLASLGIVHRDLACRNILVDDGKSLKISDFGMSRTVGANDVYVKNTRGRLPWKWMAIESIVNREFTSASDVWSYGVALWEIATLGGFPYPIVTNSELLEHLQRGERLEKPENCSPEVYEIMMDCWSTDPYSRLTFTALRAKFDSLISAQQDHSPYIDLDIDYCKPYYSSIDDLDIEEKQGSCNTSVVSTEDLPLEMNGRYDIIRPMMFENADTMGRPVENPYVDTPTKLNSYEIRFDLPTGPLEIPGSPIKKGTCLTEVV